MWEPLWEPRPRGQRGLRLCATGVISLLVAVALLVFGIVAPQRMRAAADDFVANYARLDKPRAAGMAAFNDSVNGNLRRQQIDVYLFNVTNPEAVLQGAAPVVVEVGPISFLQRVYHDDITWESSDDVIRYRTRHELTLLEEGEAALRHHWGRRELGSGGGDAQGGSNGVDKEGSTGQRDSTAASGSGCYDPVTEARRRQQREQRPAQQLGGGRSPYHSSQDDFLSSPLRMADGLSSDPASSSPSSTPFPDGFPSADDDAQEALCRSIEPPAVPIRLTDSIVSVYTPPFVLAGMVKNRTLFGGSAQARELLRRVGGTAGGGDGGPTPAGEGKMVGAGAGGRVGAVQASAGTRVIPAWGVWML